MTTTVPNTFEGKAGDVPAAELDANFEALAEAIDAESATAREAAIDTVRGDVPTDLNTLEKLGVQVSIARTDAADARATAVQSATDLNAAVTGGLAQITAAGAAVTGEDGTIAGREAQAITAVGEAADAGVQAVASAVAPVVAEAVAAASAPGGALALAVEAGAEAVAEAADLILDPGTGTLALAASAAEGGVVAAGDAQVLRVGGTPGGAHFADNSAGLAATASGAFFLRVETGDKVATVVLDNAGVAVDKEAYPSHGFVSRVAADGEQAQRYAQQLKANSRRRWFGAALPVALILIFAGQSNNTQRGTAISTVTSTDAYMPVAGNNLQLFAFNATNAEFTTHWNDLASAVVHTEGSAETPLSGAISTSLGGIFARIYACSVAIGARDLYTLAQAGPRNNAAAVVQRLCDMARAAGFRPVVAYSLHHGEQAMVNGNTEEEYLARQLLYARWLQLIAAQHMMAPDYVAPVIFHNPTLMAYGTDGATSRAVHSAIRRAARDLPNGIHGGGCYHYDTESDRVHQEETGMKQRGEWDGYLLRRFFSDGVRTQAVECVDVKWSGTTFTALFPMDVVRDTSYDWGTNLNTAVALGGFEWLDNGAPIQITALTLQGRKVVGTLASTPAGTAAQQRLRIASQTTTGALTAGANNRSGSQIRADESGHKSIHSFGDARYGVQHRWAVPQLCSVRAA